MLLRPLPYQQPDRIMMLWTGRNPDGTGGVNSYADYLSWKEQNHTFESLATYNISFGTLTDAGDPEEISGATVSPEFFKLLGVKLTLGRGIEAGDELISPDAGRPIVIAYGLWQRRFNADPQIVGKTLTIGGRARTIVGVVAPEFVQPEPFWGELAQYWTPLTVAGDMPTAHGNHFLRVIGRLAPGVDRGRAQAEMDQIGRQLIQEYPTTNKASVVVSPLHDELIGDTRPLLWMFFGALVLVLSLAVANIVNLLLARASRRRAELAIRAALGASRGRLMTQLITESTAIGLVGGLLGLLFAQLGIRLLLAYGSIDAPGIETTRLDATVIGFAALLSMATGALCGLLPAWRVARARFASSLSDVRGSSGLEVSRARMWLVAGEMALALPLLVGAALLTQTLIHEQQVDPGFDAAHALQFRVTLSGARYDGSAPRDAFFRELTTKLAALPGAQSSGVGFEPAAWRPQQHRRIVRLRARGRHPRADRHGLSGGDGRIFHGAQHPAARGPPVHRQRRRHQDRRDQRARGARDVGRGQSRGPARKFGEVGDPPDKSPWLTIVGVVGDLHHERLTTQAGSRGVPAVRRKHVVHDDGGHAHRGRSADARDRRAGSRARARSTARAGRARTGAVSSSITSSRGRRFGVFCATIFGALGLLLAAFGTFAVLSVLVAQRTREIGIRMALGAAPGRVRALVLRESLVPATLGCAAGGLIAAWGARGLSSQLFGVTPGDPATFTLAVGGLLLVAACASWWPARRAMRVDPVKSADETGISSAYACFSVGWGTMPTTGYR